MGWHREQLFLAELDSCVQKATSSKLETLAAVAIDDEKQVQPIARGASGRERRRGRNGAEGGESPVGPAVRAIVAGQGSRC